MLTIQEFLSRATTPIPVSDLTSLAADRAAFGADVIAGFRSQIELRSAAAQAVLTAAEGANRDTLLASEQRSYDAAIRERDSILSLQRAIEQRTEQRNYVPPTQTALETADADRALILTRSDTLVSRVTRPAGITDRSFGRVVATKLFGRVAGIELTPAEQRALAEGTDSAGGFTVPDVLSASFIDRVRDALVVQRAGAVIVPMTSDVLNIARVKTAGMGSPITPPIAVWKVENLPIAEGTIELERVQFKAKTLPALIKLSVELSEDSANIDRIIETELSAGLARELDRVALVGSGNDPEPEGVENQDGVDIAAANADADYDLLIDMIGAVAAANFTATARLYNAAVATALAKLRNAPAGDYLTAPAMVTAVPQFITNSIGSSGSPAATTVYVADWSQLMIGMRTSFRLEATRIGAGAFENLQVAIRAYLRADVQLAHPEAFVVRTGVTV
jgi:HK97 family phage major capsid protein